jgi:hypothetical protein
MDRPTDHRGCRIEWWSDDVRPDSLRVIAHLPDGGEYHAAEHLLPLPTKDLADRRRSFTASVIHAIDMRLDAWSWPKQVLGLPPPPPDMPAEEPLQGTLNDAAWPSRWVLVRAGGRRQWKPVEAGVADIVEMLHDPTRVTSVASCCGHGREPGHIVLADGRVLAVLPDQESFQLLAEDIPFGEEEVDLRGCQVFDP